MADRAFTSQDVLTQESTAPPLPPPSGPSGGPTGLTPTALPQPPPFHVDLPKDMDIDPPLGFRSRTYKSFTFDDIPPSQWRTRIHELYSWLQLQMAKLGAILESTLYSFVLRFIGTLFEWYDSLGEHQ